MHEIPSHTRLLQRTFRDCTPTSEVVESMATPLLLYGRQMEKVLQYQVFWSSPYFLPPLSTILQFSIVSGPWTPWQKDSACWLHCMEKAQSVIMHSRGSAYSPHSFRITSLREAG